MPIAEALGVVASIIAIVQISTAIISICQSYIGAVEGASSELRVLLIEVSALKGIAESLQFLTQPGFDDSTLFNQLASITEPMEGCKTVLKELETAFPVKSPSTNEYRSKRRRINDSFTKFKQSLKTGKASKLLQELMQYKTTINLALTSELVHDLKDVKQKTEKIQNSLNDNERATICSWIESTNPCNIHNRSQKLYEPGTGTWMFRMPEWPLFLEGTHRCLWIHGIPGAGKSILASFLAEEIEKHCTSSSSSEGSRLGYAYYYCYFGHNQDESSHFLRWIIGRLCRLAKTIPEDVQKIYSLGKTPNLNSLLFILHKVLEAFDRVYIVLDAVDESIPREDLLRVIRDLSTDARFHSLGLIVTSREYIDIEEVYNSCSIPIKMANEFVEEDIRAFVRSMVQSDAKYQKWPMDLRSELEDVIPKRAKGMFRWASCQLDILKRVRADASAINAALSNLPKTLDETYERIFLAIPEEDWLSVHHVCHWIFYHNELFRTNIPLSTLLQAVQQSTIDSLCQGSDQLHDFDGLRERCGCLLLIEQEQVYEDEDYTQNTVSFAHFTVQEYLKSSRIPHKEVGYFAFSQDLVQKQFAGIALRQALAIQPDEYDGTLQDLQTTELCELNFRLYCAVSSIPLLEFWPETIASDPSLMRLSEAFVNPCKVAHQTICQLLKDAVATMTFRSRAESVADTSMAFWETKWEHDSDPDCAVLFSFLLTAAYAPIPYLALAFAEHHNMLDILTTRLCITAPIPTGFEDGGNYIIAGTIPEVLAQYSLLLSGRFRLILDFIPSYAVVRFDLSKLLLLLIGFYVDHEDDEACPLRRLLALGANPNGPDGAFVTPLQIAASCWNLNSVKVLLQAGAKPNSVGEDGIEWPVGSPMAKFNRLNGMSSLYIVRNMDCAYHEDVLAAFDIDSVACGKIERPLFELGAIEIGPDSLDIELANQSDETAENEEESGEDESEEELEEDGSEEELGE